MAIASSSRKMWLADSASSNLQLLSGVTLRLKDNQLVDLSALVKRIFRFTLSHHALFGWAVHVLQWLRFNGRGNCEVPDFETQHSTLVPIDF
jgi:hypothetical protein